MSLSCGSQTETLRVSDGRVASFLPCELAVILLASLPKTFAVPPFLFCLLPSGEKIDHIYHTVILTRPVTNSASSACIFASVLAASVKGKLVIIFCLLVHLPASLVPGTVVMGCAPFLSKDCSLEFSSRSSRMSLSVSLSFTTALVLMLLALSAEHA